MINILLLFPKYLITAQIIALLTQNWMGIFSSLFICLFWFFKLWPILLYLHSFLLKSRDFDHKPFASNLIVVTLIHVLHLSLKKWSTRSKCDKAFPCFYQIIPSPPPVRVLILLSCKQFQVPESCSLLFTVLVDSWAWENWADKRGWLKPHAITKFIQSIKELILWGLRRII